MQISPKTTRHPKNRWLFLILVIAASIWLGGLKQQQLQAQSKPVEMANAWQQASFPVENFQAYTSPYGYRISPTTGQSQFHRGIDLAAPVGSYVRNWWAGQVVSLSDNSACGTMVKIQSGQWQHIYCHLNGHIESSTNGRYLLDRSGGIQLWEGQQIPMGSRIGRVGMTGRTTGPHLHWGLMYGSEYVDPALVLQEMFKQQA